MQNQKNNPLETQARRYFSSVRKEIKETALDEILLDKAKEEIKLYTLKDDLENKSKSNLRMKASLYGTLFTFILLVILIVFLVISAVLELKYLSIILAILILIFILATSFSHFSRKSWITKVGKYFILRRIEAGNLEVKKEDKEISQKIKETEKNLEKFDQVLDNKAKGTKYFKYLPKEYRSLYAINQLYQLSKDNKQLDVSGIYELFDFQENELDEEQEEEDPFN